MSPVAHADGHDRPWLVFELPPRVAAVINEVLGISEDAVGEPVVAQELPDVLLRIEIGTFRRQRHDGDVAGHDEPLRHVPSGLVEQQNRMAPWRDIGGDCGEVQVHRRRIAVGQDQPDRLALLWADGAEDVGRGRALVGRGGRTTAAPGPTPRDLVLLADPGFVAEPDLYVAAGEAAIRDDLLQDRRPLFLNAAMAPSAWA